jgi:UDP-N-acetylmuramate: L-alanyl-gamma-D-glutamyl-meso-diaminopimelate ligase
MNGSSENQLLKLKAGSHVHLMGICGTAMASLAGLLKDRGFKITGSELNPYPPMSTQIESMGIPILRPYKAANLNPKPDFVIVGNVISAGNEEAQELVRLGIPFTSLPKALGEFIIADKESIVIAGTHGKTTTTSILSWVTTELGFEPGFLIGGIARNFSKSFQNPKGPYFVIEGDEYDTAFFDKVPKFIHYKPRHVVLTSIEFDHADIYRDLAHVKEAFVSLMKLIPADGTLVYCAEVANVQEVSEQCRAKRKVSYGIHRGEYRAQILETTPQKTTFRILKAGALLGEYESLLSGEYNILNCTAVVALADQLGWDAVKTGKALASFLGVKRRQEVLGEPDGVLVIEDFAHHPTAVKETLKGIQDKYKGRKIHAVFEPRSATSRRKVFQKEYVQAFGPASSVTLMKAFDQTKIAETDRFSSEDLAKDLFDAGTSAHVFASADEIVQHIAKIAKTGSLVVIMSNGGFDGIYQKMLQSLESRPKK